MYLLNINNVANTVQVRLTNKKRILFMIKHYVRLREKPNENLDLGFFQNIVTNTHQ